jgi:hypothetical protein
MYCSDILNLAVSIFRALIHAFLVFSVVVFLVPLVLKPKAEVGRS